MLSALSGLCVPISFLAGSAIVYSKAATPRPPGTLADSSNYSYKRKREEDDKSNVDSQIGCAEYPSKKVRLTKSASMDEVEFSLGDTTLVDREPDECSVTESKPSDKRIATHRDTKFNGADSISENINKDQPIGDSYDPTNARHEWELRWFICAHHAAFTAATAMSLRSEVRRRKVLARLWKELKKENTSLREEIKRLSLV